MTEPFKPSDPAYETIVRESFARQGLMGLLGAWLAEVAPGRVVIELPVASKLTQQAGFVHGGVLGAIADSAGGYAAQSLLPAGSDVVTIEYKINFMRAAQGPLLRATGTVLRPGKTITVARVDCMAGTSAQMDLVAVVQATFMRVGK